MSSNKIHLKGPEQGRTHSKYSINIILLLLWGSVSENNLASLTVDTPPHTHTLIWKHDCLVIEKMDRGQTHTMFH